VNADLLIILSDIDGLYDSNPKENPDAKRISVVTEVTDDLIGGAGGAGSALGTGGMQTKVLAMNMLMDHGIGGVIAEGSEPQILEDILEGADFGTLFVPHGQKK
jgi:glutamate 5-kinase